MTKLLTGRWVRCWCCGRVIEVVNDPDAGPVVMGHRRVSGQLCAGGGMSA